MAIQEISSSLGQLIQTQIKPGKALSPEVLNQIETEILADDTVSPDELDLLSALIQDRLELSIQTEATEFGLSGEGLDPGAREGLTRIKDRLDEIRQIQTPSTNLRDNKRVLSQINTRISDLSAQIEAGTRESTPLAQQVLANQTKRLALLEKAQQAVGQNIERLQPLASALDNTQANCYF